MNGIVNAMTREIDVAAAPGRVNLIGEHIDYHGLPVLPIALERRVRVAFRPRADRRIQRSPRRTARGNSNGRTSLAPVARGDWENYLRAAARVAAHVPPRIRAGIDAEISSDLPAAAGLSSSSALIVAFTLGLLRANGYNPGFEELMEVLPEGEQFVGTRGGGMDHAASLASRAGCASLIGFDPVTIRHIPIPRGWGIPRGEQHGPRREIGRRPRGVQRAAECHHDRAREDRRRRAVDRPRNARAYLHVTTEAQRVDATRWTPWSAMTRRPSASCCSTRTRVCAIACR